MITRRCSVGAAVLWAAGLTACSARNYRPEDMPASVALQDPLPDRGLIYLIRVMNDDATLELGQGRQRLAVLPRETYTVVSLPAGDHAIWTRVGGTSGDSVEMAPVVFRVRAGERRFLYVAGRSSASVRWTPLLGAAPMLVLATGSQQPVEGSHRWTEISEIQASGMLTAVRFVQPESGAL